MKAVIKKIEFPAMDLTLEIWEEMATNELFYYDSFFYSSSESDYKKFAHNRSLVDSNGRVYKIIGKTKLSFWRKFVPFVAKHELLFEFQNLTMDKEEIRQFMLDRISNLHDNNTFIEHVKKAKTIRELVGG